MMTADEACKAAGHYSQSGQFLPAEHMYRFALQLNPRHAAALHGLGQVLYRKGSNSEAIIALRKSLELNPENADGWSDLGAALCRTLDRGRGAPRLAPWTLSFAGCGLACLAGAVAMTILSRDPRRDATLSGDRP